MLLIQSVVAHEHSGADGWDWLYINDRFTMYIKWNAGGIKKDSILFELFGETRIIYRRWRDTYKCF